MQEGGNTRHVIQDPRARGVCEIPSRLQARLLARTESVFFVSPGQSPGGRLWTDALNCTAPQADNPPRRTGRRPKSGITRLNDTVAGWRSRAEGECWVGKDLLVGLQNLRHRHRQTQSLAQVRVLLLQSHQAAPEEVLVHLAEENKSNKLTKEAAAALDGRRRRPHLSKGQRGLTLVILCQGEQIFNVLSFQK